MPLCMLSCFSHVRFFATPWTAACQALLSMGFSRQEHWSGLPFPSPMHESEKWSHSVAQSCPTLRDPMDCSLPGSSVHGIFQATVMEWGAIAFSVRTELDPLNRQNHKFTTPRDKVTGDRTEHVIPPGTLEKNNQLHLFSYSFIWQMSF